MIDLSQSTSASPLVHSVAGDPGTAWTKDAAVAIEAPPDADVDPSPEARWSADAPRTGVCGAVGPRAIALPSGGYRMYYSQILPRPGFPAGANDYDNSTTRILSAFSADEEGLVFESEPGVRVARDGAYDSHAAFAPEILKVADAGYVMYYAGYSQPNRAYVLRAVSDDGLTWHKDSEPVLSPSPGGWDGAKCSEQCVIRLPQREGTAPRYRMFYEACDGTAKDERGVWRIASATSAASRLRIGVPE